MGSTSTVPRAIARVTATGAVIAMLLLTAPSPVRAHVGISPSSAAEGSTETFVLEVGHGCDDSPTIRVSTDLSTGFDRVVPEEIDGWVLAFDGSVATWTALSGSEGSVGEFPFTARVTAAEGTVLPVPVVQVCVDGSYDWVEVLAPGQEPSEITEPAPLLTVTAGVPVETTTTTGPPETTTTVPATSPPATTAPPPPTTEPAPTTPDTVPDTGPDTTVATSDDDDGSALLWLIGLPILAGVAIAAFMVARRRPTPAEGTTDGPVDGE